MSEPIENMDGWTERERLSRELWKIDEDGKLGDYDAIIDWHYAHLRTLTAAQSIALEKAEGALWPLIRCGVPDANPSDECSITVLVSELEVANESLTLIQQAKEVGK